MDLQSLIAKTEREQRIRLTASAGLFILASLWLVFILTSPDLLGLTNGLETQKAQMSHFPVQDEAWAERKLKIIVLGQIDMINVLVGLLRLSLIFLGLFCFAVGLALLESYGKTKKLLEALRKK